MSFPQIETIFIDFDFTVVHVDSWAVLAEVALAHKDETERAPLTKEMEEISALIDDGSASFFEALQRRINLLEPKRVDFKNAAEELEKHIAPNVADTVKKLQDAGKTVRIVSGSVRDMVEPIAGKIGIPADCIDCNELDYDDDVAVQADMGNPLCHDGGKQFVVSENSTSDKAAIVGDGTDDLDVKTMGGASVFIAYTGARKNDDVVEKADKTIGDFSELASLF